MPDFQPGEIVDIAIKGARIARSVEGWWIVVDDGHGNEFRIPHASSITRVAPAEWPPLKNDVWRDRTGDLYIGRAFAAGPALFGVDGEHDADDVLQRYGPLTLVHREQQDGGESRA